MAWFWLILGGLFEVGFTTSLRFVEGFRNVPWTLAFLVSVAISMGAARAGRADHPDGHRLCGMGRDRRGRDGDGRHGLLRRADDHAPAAADPRHRRLHRRAQAYGLTGFSSNGAISGACSIDGRKRGGGKRPTRLLIGIAEAEQQRLATIWAR